MRLLFCPRLIVVFALCASPAFAGPDSPQDKPARGGSVPQDQRGRPLNFDFEAGNLSDWTAQGDAFTRQPVEGDAVSRRRGDMHSRHQGRFWVGTYEIAGDAPQGTLTSVPFRVSRPFASFLVAGGSQPTTCVELVRSDNQQVVFRSLGRRRRRPRAGRGGSVCPDGQGNRDQAGRPRQRRLGAHQLRRFPAARHQAKRWRPGGAGGSRSICPRRTWPPKKRPGP